jgi:protein-L-isoaspartate O-methyltransferase
MAVASSNPALGPEGDRALGLCLEAAQAPNAPYAEQERRFARLDELLLSDEGLADRLLEDFRYQSIRAEFLVVRAAYEYERERVLAEAIVAAGDDSPLDAFRATGSYEAAHAFELGALAPFRPQHVLVVGAGPFPSTALAFLRAYPQASVACIERREEGCRLARQVARTCGCEGLRVIPADALEVTDFSDYDCVHVGTVVGVLDAEKRRVVAHFRRCVPPSALLVFRTAVGPGRIIFPSVDLDSLEGLDYRVLADPPQKTYTMILTDRSGPAS